MTTTEKMLLIVSILVSWTYVFFIQYIFKLDVSLMPALLSIGLGAVIWLTPFAVLTLFSKQLWRPGLAFLIGSVPVLLVTRSETLLYMVVGIAMLALGFCYWYLRVRHASKEQTDFSVGNIFAGISLFFTVLAAFGGLLYYASPDVSSSLNNPKIPVHYFDVMYAPISSVLGELIPGIPSPASSQTKDEIYRNITLLLEEGVRRYEGYIPFVFAGGVFLLLRVLLLPLSYVLFGAVYALVHLFLYAQWLQKESIQVSKEIIRF